MLEKSLLHVWEPELKLVSLSTANVSPQDVTTDLLKSYEIEELFQEEKIPQVIKEFYDPPNC